MVGGRVGVVWSSCVGGVGVGVAVGMIVGVAGSEIVEEELSMSTSLLRLLWEWAGQRVGVAPELVGSRRRQSPTIAKNTVTIGSDRDGIFCSGLKHLLYRAL